MKIRKHWGVADAKVHYRITSWGMGFFNINEVGHVSTKAGDCELDLYALSQDLKDRGMEFPVLLRFPHILQRMLDRLHSAFKKAITSCEYVGNYVAAYPIKVNQQASVIQHFSQQNQHPVAFEVGSKAELIACLGLMQTQTIICNGYKDEAYIRLALTGCLLGHEVVIVLESPGELQHVLKLSAEINVQPALGMRVRLSAVANGKWQNTGGKRSKFGLTAGQVVQLLQELKKNGALGWMRMLHFHMGSQIPSLQHIREGVEEGMCYFVQLYRLGAQLSQLNVGGGLAVDYEGSLSNSYFSREYSLDEYAYSVIRAVHAACLENKVPEPAIFTESGRAMTAHHAVLVTNIIDAGSWKENATVASPDFNMYPETAEGKLKELVGLCRRIQSDVEKPDNQIDYQHTYTSLVQAAKRIDQDFSRGDLSLTSKAYAEEITQEAYRQLSRHKECLDTHCRHDLEEDLVDKYFCNFSLFRSTPDIWGLDQPFPVLPLHRLDEGPTRQVRLHDLTCDSDGQIDRYIEADSIQSYLSLHELIPGQDYLIGMFLIGAYQEILGDLHNLFGDTLAVSVEMNADGSYRLDEQRQGDTTEKVLSYVHINAAEIRKTWHTRLTEMNMPKLLVKQVLHTLETALQANSYLTSSSG
ncbi:MAG: biosynthetic arginine decarboxylase [Gammaproteobacteria bacterium]|nr:biosynthetic arginine decarboxylase [Gammaproteobacteria bacterium]